MRIGLQTFVGARLREARVARGMYKNALAERVGVTPPAIGRFESGQDLPQPHRVTMFAEVLQFPEDFFTRPVWDDELEPIFWRSRATETKSAREMTEQRMKWLCELFGYLEQDLVFPPSQLPRVSAADDYRFLSSEDIERSAKEVRKSWGFRDHPIPDLCLALENAGVPVTMLRIPSEKQDGFSFRSRFLGRAFVGINVLGVSAARARFDLAHELGHLVLHTSVSPQRSREPATHKALEAQANRFAGALLFPRDAFYREVRVVSLDFLRSLKRRWGISIAAMVSRASDLQMISDEEKSKLFMSMARRRWRGAFGEPHDSPSEMPLERPRMIKRGVEALLSEVGLSKPALRTELSIPTSEIEEIAGLDQGFLEEEATAAVAILKGSAPESKVVDLFSKRSR